MNDETLLAKYRRYVHLKLYPTTPDDITALYHERAAAHNAKLLTDQYIDAGFDLLIPTDTLQTETTFKLDHQVKCSATLVQLNMPTSPTGYYMFARSSIYKTPFRLANSVGVIDSGYRGNLIAMLDGNPVKPFTVTKGDRFVQITAPDLCPLYVEIVPTLEALGAPTTRGEGGFGSTGA